MWKTAFKNLTWLNAVFNKFYLFHAWIPWPTCPYESRYLQKKSTPLSFFFIGLSENFRPSIFHNIAEKQVFPKWLLMYRSSHRRCSIEKAVLKTLAIFEFLYIPVLAACNFIKKKLRHRGFPVNIGKFLRIPILKNNC